MVYTVLGVGGETLEAYLQSGLSFLKTSHLCQFVSEQMDEPVDLCYLVSHVPLLVGGAIEGD